LMEHNWCVGMSMEGENYALDQSTGIAKLVMLASKVLL